MPDWKSLAKSHTLQVEQFVFQNGEQADLRLHCLTLGELNPAKDNAVLLLHGTTGSSSQFLQPGTADPLFGAGKPLDCAKYFLILPDAIGHGASSKPSTTGGTNFPQYGYTDIVNAQHRVVQMLFGLHTLRLILGTSMGGMNTWMWGYLYPKMAKALMPIACLPRKLAGGNLLFRRLMLAIIETGLDTGQDDADVSARAVGLAWNVFQLVVNSPAKLVSDLKTPEAADFFIEKTLKKGAAEPALDVLWEFRASFDYDPATHLHKIIAPLLTVNFTDDQLNAPGYRALDSLVAETREGRSVIVDAKDQASGHQTLSKADVWQSYVAELLVATERKG